jgi:hypothetical protein
MRLFYDLVSTADATIAPNVMVHIIGGNTDIKEDGCGLF